MLIEQFVVLGGGLAGTFLAHRLLSAGQAVTLIDTPKPNSATRIAAGLFNPITGKNSVKSWMVDDLYAELMRFFRLDMPDDLQRYLHLLPIYRPFSEIYEYNLWTGRTGDPDYAFCRLIEQAYLPEAIENPLGGLQIEGWGWLETGQFCAALQEKMLETGRFQRIEASLHADAINYPDKSLIVENQVIHFDGLIFCEGFQGRDNPLFSGLPIIPNKGELLLLEIPELILDRILSRHVYLLPYPAPPYFLAGSTYLWDNADELPSEAGRIEICTQLEKLLKLPYRILEHKAGIRPTTHDRRPLLGTHPAYKWLHVFGGFGTKGVLLAPYFSQLMCDYLLGKRQEIPKEVNLSRYKRFARP